MTGYQSKKNMAQDTVNYGASSNYPPQPAQEPVATIHDLRNSLMYTLEANGYSRNDNLYTAPPQRPWVEPTESEWFKCWLDLDAADETEAEFDFADFLIIAQAVTAKLKEKNNG